MAYRDLTTAADAELLAAFGEPITYRDAKGGGEPVAATAILDTAGRAESSAPGYFGSVEVDPAVIAKPRIGDLVIWADGVEYVVQRVSKPEYGLTRLQLVRRFDAVEE